MGGDWNEPRDKGPQIEEPNKRWKKKARGAKPFAIEGKYVAAVDRHGSVMESLFRTWRIWHIVRRYTTEKQRDMALANLVRKEKTSRYRGRWEYRACDGTK